MLLYLHKKKKISIKFLFEKAIKIKVHRMEGRKRKKTQTIMGANDIYIYISHKRIDTQYAVRKKAQGPLPLPKKPDEKQ